MTSIAMRRRLAAVGGRRVGGQRVEDRRRRRVRSVPGLAALGRHPRAGTGAAAGLAALVAGAAGGPVAAGLAALYAGVVAAAVYRHRRTTTVDAARLTAADAVMDLAAELRAGAPPTGAKDTLAPAVAGCPVASGAVSAAWQVCERTGAPLADVLDRVAEQLRQARRLRRTVAAHQAGSRATAMLLAVLPAAGIGLGYGLGADPVTVLLHTPAGAVCAGSAAVLQLAGLLWTDRLSRVDDR